MIQDLCINGFLTYTHTRIQYFWHAVRIIYRCHNIALQCQCHRSEDVHYKPKEGSEKVHFEACPRFDLALMPKLHRHSESRSATEICSQCHFPKDFWNKKCHWGIVVGGLTCSVATKDTDVHYSIIKTVHSKHCFRRTSHVYHVDNNDKQSYYPYWTAWQLLYNYGGQGSTYLAYFWLEGLKVGYS